MFPNDTAATARAIGDATINPGRRGAFRSERSLRERIWSNMRIGTLGRECKSEDRVEGEGERRGLKWQATFARHGVLHQAGRGTAALPRRREPDFSGFSGCRR